MTLDRLQPTQLFKIKQPRWKDRTVLIAKYKVGTHNEIQFTEAKSLEGSYYISGAKAATYPINNNGKLDCYAVPLDDLEPLERTS